MLKMINTDKERIRSPKDFGRATGRWRSGLRQGCLLVFIVGFFSCATYNKTQLVQEQFQKQDFKKGLEIIRKADYYAKPKNEFLRHTESGTLYFFDENYEQSNEHFNAADYFEEDYNTKGNKAKDKSLEVVANPAATTYKGEYFERFMVHYYKILGYLRLGKENEARVELRRLEIRLNQLHDAAQNKNKKYSTDAFMHIMQGIVYEKLKEYNNAFVSYRNAYDVFTDSTQSEKGIAIPKQLLSDYLRTAKLSGFEDVYKEKKALWHIADSLIFSASPYEAVVFWENGLAPSKAEDDFVFELTEKDGQALFYSSTLDSSVSLPDIDMKGFKLSDLGVFRIAFPKLVDRPAIFKEAALVLENSGDKRFPFESVTSISGLAYRTLVDRRSHDIKMALARMAVTKVAELALVATSKAAKGKMAPFAGVAGKAAGAAGDLKEKADTRSWLTLPEAISYRRVPLKQGVNTITVQYKTMDNQESERAFQITCDKEGLYLYNVRTPNAKEPQPAAK